MPRKVVEWLAWGPDDNRAEKASPEVLRCSVPIISFITVHLDVLCAEFLSVRFHNKISH